jgi:hypothetical protein
MQTVKGMLGMAKEKEIEIEKESELDAIINGYFLTNKPFINLSGNNNLKFNGYYEDSNHPGEYVIEQMSPSNDSSKPPLHRLDGIHKIKLSEQLKSIPDLNKYIIFYTDIKKGIKALESKNIGVIDLDSYSKINKTRQEYIARRVLSGENLIKQILPQPPAKLIFKGDEDISRLEEEGEETTQEVVTPETELSPGISTVEQTKPYLDVPKYYKSTTDWGNVDPIENFQDVTKSTNESGTQVTAEDERDVTMKKFMDMSLDIEKIAKDVSRFNIIPPQELAVKISQLNSSSMTALMGEINKLRIMKNGIDENTYQAYKTVIDNYTTGRSSDYTKNKFPTVMKKHFYGVETPKNYNK